MLPKQFISALRTQSTLQLIASERPSPDDYLKPILDGLDEHFRTDLLVDFAIGIQAGMDWKDLLECVFILGVEMGRRAEVAAREVGELEGMVRP